MNKVLIGTGIAAVLLVPGLLPGLIVGAVGGIGVTVAMLLESKAVVTEDEKGVKHFEFGEKKEED